MTKRTAIILVAAMLTACMGLKGAATFDLRVYRVIDGQRMTMAELTPILLKHRIIIVGEHHTNVAHHRAQLRVIQALKEAGGKVVVGIEMFRSESQTDLDQWVDGRLASSEFEKIYYDNWNYPWQAYRMIFEYARDHRIPMIGLNIPRHITRQVARKGFQSLSDEQRGKLPDVTCRVDETYMDYIRKAYGAHVHGKMDFTHFCEAQLVWDTVMAINAVDYAEKNPESIVVILCGAGHAQKGAIPRQIRTRSSLGHLVILPEIPGSLTIETVTAEDTDYLLWNLDKAS
jgi:uncharacterized iron-regulated protein